MSNFNYMENVPVKIAEKYKPLPLIYQIPQSVSNKLSLEDGHFHDSLQFSYDFQLEHKVLAKIPEYKRKRQMERSAREERKERRAQERQRRLEEQHKQMLGAVTYPNAAELSSSESDNDEDSEKIKQEEKPTQLVINRDNWMTSHCFNNILQPTVLFQNGDATENAFNLSFKHKNATIANTSPSGNGNSNKLANSFNYKDFEDDTSSPFDNIELKTINDLDILRQVLHNTQLKENGEKTEDQKSCVIQEKEHTNVNDAVVKQNTKEIEEDATATITNTPDIVLDISTLENTKAALEKVDFSDINLGLEPLQKQNDNIPSHNYNSAEDYFAGNAYGDSSNTVNFVTPNICYPQYYSNSYSNCTQNQPNCQVYHNQNLLYSPNRNSDTTGTVLAAYSNVSNPLPASFPNQINYVHNNENKMILTTDHVKNVASFHKNETLQVHQNQDSDHQSSKSKSVPDLFQELREEVRNSEMRRRRSRNYSHNFDGNNELKDEGNNISQSTDNETRKPEDLPDKTFNNLKSSVQELARNISSMGFPLGLVAKIAQIYGEDDKKIVEHLIPLTELLDLGFDETQISEALIMCDNNKEKALEHLIS